MKVIKEYFLNENSIEPQALYIPPDAEILSVQKTTSGIILNVLEFLLDSIPKARLFKVCRVNETIYHNKINYIGSFENTFGRCHIVEILE